MGFDLIDCVDDASFLSVSFWDWRPTVAAIRALAVLPDERVQQLTVQFCGYGLSAEEARLVARAIRERVLPTLADGDWIRLDGTRTTTPPDPRARDDEWERAYGVDRSGLERFLSFCEQCSGFTVQ